VRPFCVSLVERTVRNPRRLLGKCPVCGVMLCAPRGGFHGRVAQAADPGLSRFAEKANGPAARSSQIIRTPVLEVNWGKKPDAYRRRVEKTTFLNRFSGAELRCTFDSRIAPWSEAYRK
jgi:hypothetical protein